MSPFPRGILLHFLIKILYSPGIERHGYPPYYDLPAGNLNLFRKGMPKTNKTGFRFMLSMKSVLFHLNPIFPAERVKSKLKPTPDEADLPFTLVSV